MTISTTTYRADYNGNGVTTAFAIPFYFFDNTHMKVLRTQISTGVVTTLVLGSDYNVAGAGVSTGGTLTCTTAPTSDQRLSILRNVPLTQLVHYVPNDPFPAATHEQALDQLTMEVQQLREVLDRSLKISANNTIASPEFNLTAAQRANKVLSFDPNGDFTVTQELGTAKGNWSSSTSYALRDIIKDTSNGNVYICTSAHVSSGSQPISTNTDAAKWTLLVDAASATSSATAAAASASAASTSATAAAGSASAAATSASAASASATSAASSAANSASNAAGASASATSATNSAAAAATSATGAASSATAAAASAASAAAIVLNTSTGRPSIRPSLLLDFAKTKALDPRITFTRASTATYYDGSTSVMAEQNLLTYSQDYTQTAWNKGGVTFTANTTTAPDGTSTAGTITCNAGSSAHDVFKPTYDAAAGTATFSAYVKAGTNNFVSVTQYTGGGGTYCAATANLSTGTISQTGGTAYVSSSIASAGNGWYRVSVTGTFAGTVSAVIVVNSTATPTYGSAGVETWTAAGTEAVYVWGSQQEQRSTVSAYTPTTSTAITNYIPAMQTAASGVARFDHNPTTGDSLGLLVEEQRSNLVTYSAAMDDASWTKSGSSVTANIGIAPDGTQSADLWVPTSTGATGGTRLLKTLTVASGTAHTISAYVKARGKRWVMMASPDASADTYNSWFDLTNGVVGTKGASVTSTSITAVGNGWYRITATATTTGAVGYVYISTTDADNLYGVTADGYSGIYVWGAQIEAGGFATSYIPTTSAQVTRSADSATMTGTNFSSWFNVSEGSIHATLRLSGLSGGGNHIAAISSGNNNNVIDVYQSSASQLGMYVACNGAAQVGVSVTTSVATNTQYKVFMAYKTNDFAMTNSGATIGSSSSGFLPTVTTMYIGCNGAGSTSGALTIARLALYPKRVANNEMLTATS